MSPESMLKKISLIIFSVYIIIFFYDPLYSFDSSFFCVPLRNFSVNLYSEKISKYKLIITDNEFVLPDTSTQKILSKEKKNDFVLLLQAGRKANPGYHSDPPNNYLSDSRLLNLDDPDILKLKHRFNNSRNIINDVENFVYKHISNKTYGIPVISASEIYKNKTGDCTEHTVLTVAILRASGIPARALVGMVVSEEFEGNRDVFVYHMWAEAFIDGRWILVDSTSPGEKHENRYVAFAYHHLQTEMPLAYLKAVSAMKKFSVEYVK
jgi:transglutaminase-like putative cysteine protease